MGLVPWWDEAKSKLIQDQILAEIIARYPNEGLAIKNDPFHTLARAIIGQQISVTAADAVWGRLEEMCGGTIDASKVIDLSVEDLRSIGCSRRKGEYMIHAAERIDAIVMQGFEQKEEMLIDRLTTLRGIGPWTAEMFLIFALGKPDVFPIGDVGLIRGLHLVAPETSRLDSKSIIQFAERWKPWRTAATWYLWRTIDPVPVAY